MRRHWDWEEAVAKSPDLSLKGEEEEAVVGGAINPRCRCVRVRVPLFDSFYIFSCAPPIPHRR